MWGPRLEGRIVVLRPVAESEIPTMLRWFADPLVLRFLAAPFFATAPAAEKDWWTQSGADRSSVLWGLEYEGRLVGTTGMRAIDWMSRNAATGTAIGDRTAWRKGIATEAMQIRAEYAFRQLGLHKLNSGYAEGNAGSAEAQRRAGYREVGRLRDDLFRDGRWHDMIVTEILRDDWEAAHPPVAAARAEGE